MNTYEELQDEACKDGIEIIDNHSFKSDRISGLYCNNTIALSKNLKNSTEKHVSLPKSLDITTLLSVKSLTSPVLRIASRNYAVESGHTTTKSVCVVSLMHIYTTVKTYLKRQNILELPKSF